jgi:hypothetical protein
MWYHCLNNFSSSMCLHKIIAPYCFFLCCSIPFNVYFGTRSKFIMVNMLIKHDCRFQNVNVKASSSMLSLNSMCNWATSSSCHCFIVPYTYSNTNNKPPPCKCTINNLIVYSFTRKLQKTKWLSWSPNACIKHGHEWEEVKW